MTPHFHIEISALLLISSVPIVGPSAAVYCIHETFSPTTITTFIVNEAARQLR